MYVDLSSLSLSLASLALSLTALYYRRLSQAPTNAAFDALPAGTLDILLDQANKDTLVDILTYHVLDSVVRSTDLSEGLQADTLNGDAVTATIANGAMINNAKVSVADVEASNGVVHVIDAVLLPPDFLTVTATLQPYNPDYTGSLVVSGNPSTAKERFSYS